MNCWIRWMMVALMAGTAARAETLKVDKARSRIQVDIQATGHAFTGTLDDYTATVRGDPGSLAAQAVELKWTFDNLKTGEADRDKAMLKWLGGGKPAGSFKFDKSWKDKEGRDFAMGQITIHGVSKTVSFPYSVKKEGQWVTIDGNATLDYQDFSLPIIRTMAVMTVDPRLSVRFHVVGRL